jgi:hypothetical protein
MRHHAIGFRCGLETQENFLIDMDACRRLIAALLLRSLKDRISRNPAVRYEALLFIDSPWALRLAGLIDQTWPPTEAMLIAFAADPTLCLTAFRTA